MSQCNPLTLGAAEEPYPEDGGVVGRLSISESDYSSSLLRVCSYPNEVLQVTDTDASDNRIAFGSHTDTTFVTVGLCSSNPGLEVRDVSTGVCHVINRSFR